MVDDSSSNNARAVAAVEGLVAAVERLRVGATDYHGDIGDTTLPPVVQNIRDSNEYKRLMTELADMSEGDVTIVWRFIQTLIVSLGGRIVDGAVLLAL